MFFLMIIYCNSIRFVLILFVTLVIATVFTLFDVGRLSGFDHCWAQTNTPSLVGLQLVVATFL